jgi:hypothetical protein
MKYELKRTKSTCYADGNAVENYTLSFGDAEENEECIFSVYERETDGCLRWIADFGNRVEAEKWKAAMEKED